MKLKIVAIAALTLLNISTMLSAAQWTEDEISQSNAKILDDTEKGKWDEDRKLLAKLSDQDLVGIINTLSDRKKELNQQIKDLSKRYGELIAKSILDKAAIKAIEYQQEFVIKQLKHIEDYIQELEYQIERNLQAEQT